MLCKNQLHDLRSPADRIGTECRHCHDKRQTTYRERQRLALALLRQMESAGLKTPDLNADSGFAVGLAWAN
ncbi:hypothetical protein ACWKSR_12905, partial [Campylobacter fetus subsp. venerealis]